MPRRCNIIDAIIGIRQILAAFVIPIMPDSQAISFPRRRRLLGLVTVLIAGAMVLACSTPGSVPGSASPSAAERPPIVFVHGNGDTAALWLTTLWRFESNGWPRDRLLAIDTEAQALQVKLIAA